MKRAYCEPFCIEKGYAFEIHNVAYDIHQPYSCFMHFHEVHEFIIFDQVDGNYFYNQGQSKLESNDVVFTPAMETHDFELNDGAKSWHIIQLLPEFFHQDDIAHYASFFKQGMHLRIDDVNQQELKQIVAWLLASYQVDPQSAKSKTLLKLLIIWIAEHATAVTAPNILPITATVGYERLLPVINRFRHDSAVRFSLVDAAKMCHLSPSYFSRLFKKIFRFSFSEYVLRHKLYSAARILSMADVSITELSYDLDFSSPSHFIAQFKRQFSMTPLQYQKSVIKRSNM